MDNIKDLLTFEGAKEFMDRFNGTYYKIPSEKIMREDLKRMGEEIREDYCEFICRKPENHNSYDDDKSCAECEAIKN